MNDILTNFTHTYSLNMDRKIFSKDAQRNLQSPILFVFVGDAVSSAVSVINNIKDKWNNGEGIIFVNISTKDIEDSMNIFNFQIPIECEDKKTLRKSIRDKFYSNKELLQKFNKKLTTVRDNMLSFGELFNSFENLSISVITRADDPLNIILPEISILTKKRMMEVFKSSIMDLYVLVKEQNLEDEFYSKVLSASFFREVEYIQKKDFKFNENIAIYGEGRELPVEENGPIFYLTYLLEEKNEKGLIPKNSMENNYEIVSYISLLKNIGIEGETYSDIENQYYDNGRFKVNIKSTSLENEKNIYSTGGLSKVKRPNGAIAATVTRAVYENVLNKMKYFSKKHKDFVAEILKIDESSLHSMVEDLMPQTVKIADMISIMTQKVKNEFYRLTVRESEESLYENRCEEFFKQNFIYGSEKNLYNMKLEDKVEGLIKDYIISNPKLGIYCAWLWTLEEGEGINYIRQYKNLIEKNIENLNRNIENTYENKALDGFNIKSIFFKDEKIKEVKIKYFIYTK
ncbi:hypothetical protein [Clostridium tetanomorphum]|uniref:hypothetical protein n=1 Tax=Clostridium tetanomorphum TaxID=1553 RepID=UPI000D8736F3|nr:hypothetical protein [Clostridium tetanomorphum]SQB92754.1 Uncharacterised protein [Clostridium tetanomorphum]